MECCEGIALSLFITFEGGEGCGKSTHARVLCNKLSRSGVSVICTHEPGGTPLGDELSRWLNRAEEDITPELELLLFAASRARLVTEVIRPNLERGAIVISDRYAHSTVAYQGYGRGLDLGVIETINNIASGGIFPSLVILLDIDPQVGLARKKLTEIDRFEREELTFHRRVREGYLKMASSDTERWMGIDATLPPTDIEQMVWEKVNQLLQKETFK